jgi:hypothetical protein
MRRAVSFAGTLLAGFCLATPAEAACPAGEPILSELTCSSTVTGRVSYSEASDLGGGGRNVYSCGSPYSGLSQTSAEDVYSFTCQRNGTVTLEISGLDCDLDIYILDDTCDPYTGCEDGSTAASYTTDSVTFSCTAGDTYYVVIEGYGFGGASVPAGICTGASEGDYTLGFDVTAGTGCSEDCDNGFDDDFDGDVDCDDSDCAGDPSCHCDDDADGYDATTCGGTDCNDADASIHPGATEYCDGVDEDCDGTVDDNAVDASTWYRDADSDGYGNPSVTTRSCNLPAGYTSNATDCYDGDATAHPSGTEAADGVDDDCDGIVDEGTDAYDDDGDGYAENGGDCDDGDGGTSPATLETCNGLDDDCDGTTDEGTDCYDDDRDGRSEDAGDCNDNDGSIGPGEAEIDGNLVDDDCDGIIDAGIFDPDGDGYTADGGDCDDHSASAHPGATETANGVDDDCDGVVDEGTAAYDDDHDGQTENAGDCNDADADVSTGSSETANGLDDDCDGLVDEGGPTTDDDGDGLSEDAGDCDDADADVSPAGTESANGVDDDCDGQIDEADDDGDLDGYSAADGDCNDADGWINPARPEDCDGIDNNCNDEIDEGDCVTGTTSGAKQEACGCATGGGSAGLGLLVGLAALALSRRKDA